MDRWYVKAKEAVVNFKLDFCCWLVPVRLGCLVTACFNIIADFACIVGVANEGFSPLITKLEEILIEDYVTKPPSLLAYTAELAMNVLLISAIYRRDLKLMRVFLNYSLIAAVTSFLLYSIVIAAVPLELKLAIACTILFQLYTIVLVRSLMVEIRLEDTKYELPTLVTMSSLIQKEQADEENKQEDTAIAVKVKDDSVSDIKIKQDKATNVNPHANKADVINQETTVVEASEADSKDVSKVAVKLNVISKTPVTIKEVNEQAPKKEKYKIVKDIPSDKKLDTSKNETKSTDTPKHDPNKVDAINKDDSKNLVKSAEGQDKKGVETKAELPKEKKPKEAESPKDKKPKEVKTVSSIFRRNKKDVKEKPKANEQRDDKDKLATVSEHPKE